MNPILISNYGCKSKTSSIRAYALTSGAVLLLLAGVMSSCSTTGGFGRDVEKTGEKIQGAANAAAQ